MPVCQESDRMSHSSSSRRSSVESLDSVQSASTALTTPFSSPSKASKAYNVDSDSESDEPSLSSSSASALNDAVTLPLQRFSHLLSDNASISRHPSPAPRPPAPRSWFNDSPGDVLHEGSDEEAARLKQLEKLEPLLQPAPDRFVLFPIKYPQVR
jgi:hypothetical protein